MEPLPSSPPPATVVEVKPIEVLQKLLDHLGLQTHVDQYNQDDAIVLHIATVEPGRLIGRGGETLNQLQYLLNRMLQRMDPQIPRVIVDCERYRERQRDDLIRKVVQAAERVRRWGDPVRIGPYSAFDRRIIHQRMERDPELEVISDGGEENGNKHMTIRIREETPKNPGPVDGPSAPTS